MIDEEYYDATLTAVVVVDGEAYCRWLRTGEGLDPVEEVFKEQQC